MKQLINILEDNNYSPFEIIELLDDIDENDIKEFALSNGICRLCGGDVLLCKWKEDRGEYFGFPAYEDMEELKCESCGETY